MIKDSEKRIIGAVKVIDPFVYRDSSYECAAWWEERTAVPGVYPVYLSRNRLHPKELILSGEVKATVTDDYFPGLFGGVRISNEPYKPKHLGEERTIRKGIQIIEAIERTGNSPSKEIDWFIHPSWWKVFAHEAETNLRNDYAQLPSFWDKWDNLKPETFQPIIATQSFDDDYRAKVGMIAHFGMCLERWARVLEKLNWQSQFHKPGSRYDTEYYRNQYASNTEWSKAIPIEVLP